VELPEDLADTTILVLGLAEMGYTNVAEIADILRLRNKRPLRRLLRMLKTSRNPVVRRCVDVGLPPGLCRPFPYQGTTVRCPICRSMTDHAPCPRCSVARNRADPDPPRKDRPLAAAPTDAQPGSRKKLAVLRRRAAQGLALFHPHDGPGE